MMYKKRKNLPLLLAVLASLALLILLASLYIYKGHWSPQEDETEGVTETSTWEAILYKPEGAVIEFDEAYLESDTQEEASLRIPQGDLVTLTVTPKTGESLEKVEIVDYDFNEIQCLLTASGKTSRINFVMPDRDVILNFYLEKNEAGTEAETETLEETEDETETVTEQEAPYGLTLSGLTADFIVSFNGLFDDRAFLQALGEALHMDSARSSYQDVTQVTISGEPFDGTKEADTLPFYVYFNGDPQRKILCTYYFGEDSYLFTEVEPETEAVTETTLEPDQAAEAEGGEAAANQERIGYTGGGTAGNSGASSGSASTITLTTSLDLLSISTTFLSFTGSQETFYQETFDYVLDAGLTGEITGTMTEYEIDPEKDTASFAISLNTGDTLNGTFHKSEGRYRFSGL